MGLGKYIFVQITFFTKMDFFRDNNSEITACIAPQFAKQGYPVAEYGEKVCELYGKF